MRGHIGGGRKILNLRIILRTRNTSVSDGSKVEFVDPPDDLEDYTSFDPSRFSIDII